MECFVYFVNIYKDNLVEIIKIYLTPACILPLNNKIFIIKNKISKAKIVNEWYCNAEVPMFLLKCCGLIPASSQAPCSHLLTPHIGIGKRIGRVEAGKLMG